MKPTPLTNMTLGAFVDEIASNSPAPGGGSASALAGALSAALSAMVANLTFEKKGFEEKRGLMEDVGVEAQKILREQVKAVDEDTSAFNKVMDAFSLPKETDAQKAARKSAIADANKGATLEPLGTLERALAMIELAKKAAEEGNPNSLSDAGVAVQMARAGAFGAYYNVLINLGGIEDKKWRDEIRKKADEIIKDVAEKTSVVERDISSRLKKEIM